MISKLKKDLLPSTTQKIIKFVRKKWTKTEKNKEKTNSSKFNKTGERFHFNLFFKCKMIMFNFLFFSLNLFKYNFPYV